MIKQSQGGNWKLLEVDPSKPLFLSFHKNLMTKTGLTKTKTDLVLQTLPACSSTVVEWDSN